MSDMAARGKHRPRLQEVLTRGLTLRRLEWLGVLLPLAFLALYSYLLLGPADSLLDSPWSLLALMATLAVVVTLFARLMFRAVRRMQRNLEQLSRIAARQNAQLWGLNEANLALSQERLVSAVLQRVVDLSRQLVQARYAALGVVGNGDEIEALYASGLDEKDRQAIGPLPAAHGLLGPVLRGTESLRLESIADHPLSLGFPSGHPPMTTFLGIPVRYKGRTVGGLYLADKLDGHPFSQEDEEIVRSFANQAAVAIQNARLYEHIQALAVETERTRISREMHDGLAQVLGFVNAKAQAVEGLIANGNVVSARRHVQELSLAARKVYQDIREGILGLRTQMASGRQFRDVLEEYVSEYELQSRIHVAMEWMLQPKDMELSPLEEVQLLRIVQESLTNVRRHAEATEVAITFTERDGDLQVAVTDNGKGFNPLAVRRGEWPHLGLQTMQERAEAIGGAFDIDSAPGKGTTVRILLPRVVHPRATRGAP